LGVVWVDHDSNGAKDRKLHADGPINWLAHSESGLLFLKTFESLSPGTEAPGEALVEIFVSGGAPYVELEQQGAYRSLEPGKAIIWRVHWRLVRAHPEVGKSELFALVRSLLEVTPR
jgi:hypothetical protein